MATGSAGLLPACVQHYSTRVSVFDLGESLRNAQRRFGGTSPDARSKRLGQTPPRGRADRGHARIDPRVERQLQGLLQGREKPSMASLGRELQQLSKRLGVAPPARGTLYNAVARAKPPTYATRELPRAVREALYNSSAAEASGGESSVAATHVPGDQIVFYCFNYGDVRAISYGAGMPWLCLVHAAVRRGFRPKSLSLLRAVMAVRGI